jgi:hypothetical protein
MRRVAVLALLVLSPMVWPAASKAQTPGPEPRVEANAAMKYWQAFALLPQFNNEEQKTFEDGNKASLQSIEKLVEKSRNSLRYLHRGMKIRQCDWSLDYEDGIELLMPHLQKSRDLCRLACFRARIEFDRGNSKGAVDDALAALTLARQAGREPILICNLVEWAIETNVIETLAANLPKADAACILELTRRLAELPPGATVKNSIKGEARLFYPYVKKMVQEMAAKDREGWFTKFKGLLAPNEDPILVQKLEAMGPQEVLKQVEDLSASYAEMARLVDLPRDQFSMQWDRFEEKTKAANPLAAMLLPAMRKVMAAEDRSLARWALLKAAIAVVQGGKGKLGDYPDPFGKGPFLYQEIPGGFVLKSKLAQADNKPVQLTVGTMTQE